MPNIADLTASIGQSRVFSELDLLKGYFQVPVHPDDVPKTTIITPFGSYFFHYSTFGLRNSGATFQCMMDQIFGDVPFCLVYVDDILIFSDNDTDHAEHLQRVLQLLKDNVSSFVQINISSVSPRSIFWATRSAPLESSP